MPFVSLGLSPSLCNPLASWATPRPRRSSSSPFRRAHRPDLLARAQTGTGKTAAFGLPMIQRLLVRGGAPAGDAQAARRWCWCRRASWRCRCTSRSSTYGVPANLRVTAIFGGVSIVPQKRDCSAAPTSSSPRRDACSITWSGAPSICRASRCCALDEADRMLDMGFLPPLRRILKVLPRERQTLLFSATFSQDVVRLSADFTRDPQRVDVSEGQVMAPDGHASRASGVRISASATC